MSTQKHDGARIRQALTNSCSVVMTIQFCIARASLALSILKAVILRHAGSTQRTFLQRLLQVLMVELTRLRLSHDFLPFPPHTPQCEHHHRPPISARTSSQIVSSLSPSLSLTSADHPRSFTTKPHVRQQQQPKLPSCRAAAATERKLLEDRKVMDAWNGQGCRSHSP